MTITEFETDTIEHLDFDITCHIKGVEGYYCSEPAVVLCKRKCPGCGETGDKYYCLNHFLRLRMGRLYHTACSGKTIESRVYWFYISHVSIK